MNNADVQQLLSEATEAALLVSPAKRAEHVGLYLIAKADGGRLPSVPQGKGANASAEDRAVLEAIVAAEVETVTKKAAGGAENLQRAVGERLCPRAAPIPADAYLTSYPLCRTPPYIIQIDAFLNFPGPGYHFSMPRVLEAKRQAWTLIRHLHEAGTISRLVLMAGNPATGKSTWIQKVGAAEADSASAVYFDDLLNDQRKRGQWWEAFREAKLPLPVEIVHLVRPFDKACASNKLRGAKGGHEVPQEVMERFDKEAQPPTLDEGFMRVRTFENQYDDESGQGGYALVRDEHREGQA